MSPHTSKLAPSGSHSTGAPSARVSAATYRPGQSCSPRPSSRCPALSSACGSPSGKASRLIGSSARHTTSSRLGEASLATSNRPPFCVGSSANSAPCPVATRVGTMRLSRMGPVRSSTVAVAAGSSIRWAILPVPRSRSTRLVSHALLVTVPTRTQGVPGRSRSSDTLVRPSAPRSTDHNSTPSSARRARIVRSSEVTTRSPSTATNSLSPCGELHPTRGPSRMPSTWTRSGSREATIAPAVSSARTSAPETAANGRRPGSRRCHLRDRPGSPTASAASSSRSTTSIAPAYPRAFMTVGGL